VLGQAAAFTLQGRMAAAEDLAAVTAELALQRVDEPTAWATLDAELVRATRTLTLNLEAEETGDLLAYITDRPEAGDFRLTLTGTGPADSWLGQLTMVAENLARVDADVALALLDEPRLAAEGRLVPHADLVPAELAELLGDALAFDLAVTQTAAQRLTFDEIHLVTDLARLDGQAVLDLETQRIDARAATRIDDLAPLSTLAETPLAGSLVLGLSAEIREL
jgi:translocation and assembly module TamB